MTELLIVGQGLAGSCLAWALWRRGISFRVVDAPQAGRASWVSAGLITPISGKRFAITWKFVEALPVARSFYESLTSEGCPNLFTPRDIVRIFQDETERGLWSKRRDWPALKPWVKEEYDEVTGDGVKTNPGGVRWRGGASVDVARFLTFTRNWLTAKGWLLEASVDPASLIEHPNRIELAAWEARRIVFCEGFRVRDNPRFDYFPLRLARGDLLTLRVTSPLPSRVYTREFYLLPGTDQTARLGATFSTRADPHPRREDLESLLAGLHRMLDINVEVQTHEVGVRPNSSHFRPVAGFASAHPRAGIFNSLGSKGALFAPWIAEALAEHLTTGKALHRHVDLEFYWQKYGKLHA